VIYSYNSILHDSSTPFFHGVYKKTPWIIKEKLNLIGGNAIMSTPRIVIVEDERIVAEDLTRTLEERGYRICMKRTQPKRATLQSP
jgi:hypothetical protein